MIQILIVVWHGLHQHNLRFENYSSQYIPQKGPTLKVFTSQQNFPGLISPKLTFNNFEIGIILMKLLQINDRNIYLSSYFITECTIKYSFQMNHLFFVVAQNHEKCVVFLVKLNANKYSYPRIPSHNKMAIHKNTLLIQKGNL